MTLGALSLGLTVANLPLDRLAHQPGSVAGYVVAFCLEGAALFNPLRRRVQHAVDRRFNRARYDAEQILAAFTGQLRQTVDLGTVQGDLVTAVRQAFEPAHVSVWLAGRDH